MMPYFDAIFNVLKRHDAVTDLGVGRAGFAGGEDVFKDLHHALAERGGEVFEDEVGIGFRDCASGGGWEVVPEVDVVQAE